MLRLYDKNHNFIGRLLKYADCKKESDAATGDATLSFTYLAGTFDIQNEFYVQTKDAEYVVKEVSGSRTDGQDIVAVLNLEALEQNAFQEFSVTDATIEEAARLFLAGTGWTVGECTVTKRRNAGMRQVDARQGILKLCTAFMCEPVFDTRNKTVSFYDEVGEDKGVYFLKGLNLRKLSKTQTSYDFYTRIIPIGADGLTIEGVNGGVNYLENHQYSDKIRTMIWEDDSYTDAQALMEDAEKKLADLSKPAVEYSADIIDLAAQKPEYGILSFHLGDTITLIDQNTGTREKQRIRKVAEYEQEPERNTCELGNTVLTFEELQDRLQAAAEIVGYSMTSDGKIHVSDILKWEEGVAGSQAVQGLNSSVSTLNGQYGALSLLVGTINANYLSVEQANMKYADIERLEAAEATVHSIQGDYAEFKSTVTDELSAQTALIDEVLAKTVTTDYLEANYATIESLNATNATVGNLSAAQAEFETATAQNFEAQTATINELRAAMITTDYLTANYAQIDLANIKDGCITTAMIGQGVVGTVQIADSSITDAKIVELTANKITAGTLSVERLEIRGSEKSIVYALNNITGALQAQNVNTLNGEILTPRTITADKIVANSITGNEIAARSIMANNLVANSITTAELSAGCVTTTILAAGAVTADNIAAGAVTADKLAAGSIVVGKLDNSLQGMINGATAKVEVQYATSSSPTVPPTSGWSTTAPEWESGQYMWQKTVTTHSDGSVEETAVTCLSGAIGQTGATGAPGKDGAPGAKGADGTSFKILISAYRQTQAELEGWATPGKDAGNWAVTSTAGVKVGDSVAIQCYNTTKSGYVYVYGTVTVVNSATVLHMISAGMTDKGDVGATGAQGPQGATGAKGKGVKSIVPQYYLSTSNTTQAGGSWGTAEPTWVSGKYIWTRSLVTFDDSTTTTTTPVLAAALNSANSTAASAKSTADAANSTANTAKSTADSAKTTATAAQSTANAVDKVIADWCYSNNRTYINGAKIYTGTVSATQLAANSVTTEKIAVGLGGNLYPNYDTFEQITNETLAYRAPTAGGSASIDATTAYYGSQCVKLVSGGSSYVYLGCAQNNYGCIPVIPGKIYRVSCYAKSTNSCAAKLWLCAHTSIGTAIAADVLALGANVGTSWTRIEGTYAATSAYPYVSVCIGNYTSGTTAYFDAIQIEEVSNTSQTASPFKPSGMTVINGANIITGTVTADKINTTSLSAITANLGTVTAGTIRSATYGYSSGAYSTSGMEIGLTGAGYIRAKNFGLDTSGNAHLKGEVNATSLVVNDSIKMYGTNWGGESAIRSVLTTGSGNILTVGSADIARTTVKANTIAEIVNASNLGFSVGFPESYDWGSSAAVGSVTTLAIINTDTSIKGKLVCNDVVLKDGGGSLSALNRSTVLYNGSKIYAGSHNLALSDSIRNYKYLHVIAITNAEYVERDILVEQLIGHTEIMTAVGWSSIATGAPAYYSSCYIRYSNDRLLTCDIVSNNANWLLSPIKIIGKNT